jgi:hypothetical protein
MGPFREPPMRRLVLLAAALLLATPALGAEPPPAPAPAPATAPAPTPGWRMARFGMTPAQILAVFPGEATRLDPEVKLADGNVVAVGIDGYEFEGLSFDVRFVFSGNRLVVVSLKAGRKGFVDATAYERLRDALAKRWGAPLEETSDSNFIDMRQTRWKRGPDRVDLKFIPGTAVLQFYPAPQ